MERKLRPREGKVHREAKVELGVESGFLIVSAAQFSLLTVGGTQGGEGKESAVPRASTTSCAHTTNPPRGDFPFVYRVGNWGLGERYLLQATEQGQSSHLLGPYSCPVL